MHSPFILFWFRRDLRLKDNIGLFRALLYGKERGQKVQPLFIFDTDILGALDNPDDFRISFLWQTLVELKAECDALGSDLWFFYGKPLDIFKELFRKHKIQAVFSNEDYEPAAISRDQNVKALSSEFGTEFFQFKDQVIFAKDELLTTTKGPYTVFTPYKNKWLTQLSPTDLQNVSIDNYQTFFKEKSEKYSLPTVEKLGFRSYPSDFYPARKVVLATLKNYEKTRDIPSQENGTSHLGLHLRFGTISPRFLIKIAKKENAATYLSELIWREFFMQILWHFPENQNQSFRKEFDQLPWRENKSEFQRWCQGQTGVPLVDAGMRELNQTGYMHNRVRMVVASYLTKHLLMHWKLGERYFARQLLDYDLAANNGNWQWVAGCGCDAAPYFRIFNPEIQSKKFDPKNSYIQKWVPELGTNKYPKPIITHQEGRDRALRMFASNLQKGKAK